MGDVDLNSATVLAGLFLGNIGAILAGYVSMKVAIAKLEVKVEKLDNDANNLGSLYRSFLNSKSGENKNV